MSTGKFTTENGDIVVNGRIYPMWQQFEQRKDEWVGGRMEPFGDYKLDEMQRAGEITDIALEPSSLSPSAFFCVRTPHGGVAVDVQELVLSPSEGGPGLVLESMRTGLKFRITKKGDPNGA